MTAIQKQFLFDPKPTFMISSSTWDTEKNTAERTLEADWKKQPSELVSLFFKQDLLIGRIISSYWLNIPETQNI